VELLSADKWYKFQATTTACRINLTATSWNGALQLCDENLLPVAGGAENAVNGAGNEILIKEGLTVGEWYYISVGGANAGDEGNFSLCIQLFLSSACNTSTVLPLDICSPFRARSTGASSFTYTFSPINTGVGGGSVTVPGLVTLSNSALNLIPGQQYSVNVACNYTGLVNGAGVPRPNVIMTGDASACVVTIAAHQDLQVRASQRCEAPATLLRNAYLRTDPFVCNVANYTYEFTPTSSCSDYAGIGLPFTYNHISRNIALNFNGTTTAPTGQTIQPQTYYIVRVRPNFGTGGVNPGIWGTPRIIFIGGTLMAESEETSAVPEQLADVSLAIYPNPGSGESIQLELEGFEGEVNLLLMDQFGRLIETKNVNASEVLVYQWMFDSLLANGLYHIRAINKELILDKKYLVTH
jgi:hypothetical protein